ncbi:MAG: phytoene desaturase [Gemmataceae bacterium]|nr:phytoene desaturase [Gemmataceae bacterium]
MAESVVIVGAGPGGLAAAMILARAGLRVTVLERLDRPGGRTSSIEAEGFRFDLGPTFFLFPLSLERVFRACGRDLRSEVPMVRLDPQYHLIFGSGGELKATPNVDRMIREVEKLSVSDAGRFRQFLADNRRKLACFQPALESPFLGWSSMFSWDLIKLLPLLRPWKSLNSELASYFRDPRVRLAFSFQSKYLGMSPFQCPSLFSILSFLEYEHGVYHPIGGCSAVMEHMARVAEDLGVEIRYGEEVEEVLFRGRRASGVRTASGVFSGDAIVINADFAQAMTRLVPNSRRRTWTDKAIAKKRYSCSTFMLYLGIEGQYEHLSHHSIYMAADYERNLREIESDHVLSADPSLYVQNACVTDPGLAPDGGSTLYVLAPVSHVHSNIDWNREAPAFRRVVLQQLQKRLGCSDIEKRIRFEKMVTPADWESKYHVYRGATFNLAHNLGQMLHFRPRNRFDEVPGTYLVGGGTHPGSGLPVIFESARITSRLLLGDLGKDHSFVDVPGSLEVPEYVG